MKVNKAKHIGLGRILEVVEDTLLRIWETTDHKIDELLEGVRKYQKKKKVPKKITQKRIEEIKEAHAVRQEIYQSKMAQRFDELEKQQHQPTKEHSIDINY